MNSGPNLLVNWEPRWEGFKSSVGPALSRSSTPLSLECDLGMHAGRSTFASFFAHVAGVFFLFALFTHGVRLPAYEHVDPYDTFDASQYHIIYYRGQNLPEMTDAGGAQEGESGKSGGRELFHPTQVIRIARGNKLVNVVVDAPSLKLARTNEPVANVFSLPAGPIPAPPLAGLQALSKASAIAPNLTPVEAAPTVARDRINGPQLLAKAIEPAPTVGRQLSGMRLPETGNIQPVPAPISATPQDIGHVPKLQLPAVAVVEPAPNSALPVGSRNVNGPVIATVEVVDVVPPAPSGASGGGGGLVGSALKALGSMIGTAAPPSASNVNARAGGTGNGAAGSPNGSGAGSANGSPGGGGLGLIASANPGGVVGVPYNGEPGSLSMSPNGGSSPGLGGSGGGTGIGRGTGTGSGTHGSGPGAGASGAGLGIGGTRPGTSTSPGPGGTGTGRGNGSGVPGVTIHGGTVSLPSFGTASSTPGMPSRSPGETRRPPAITIIATSRSGGAIDMYGALKGAKVYTIYIDTQVGMAVLQFAERAGADTDFSQDLTAPEPMKSDMPSDIPKSRVLLSCVMDKTGALKNIRVLDSVKADVTARVMAAVQKWRFRPVLRGDDPVDVDAILGFNIDTADH